MGFKNSIAHAVRHTSAYDILRDSYQRLFNRSYWKQRRRTAAFFSQFVGQNDLVFDIGANVGEYTRMFVTLGARVVAVEPNPQLTPLLEQIRPLDRVRIETAAVGSANGTSELYLCDRDVLSTLSRDWVEIAEKSDRFSGIKWNQKITVPVVTLDELIAKHGIPDFIKLDVEGFESDALAGLSKAPRYSSFEVNSEFPDSGIKCLKQPCFTPESRCNLTFDLSTEFIFADWIDRGEMIRFLGSSEFLGRRTYGDILVRTEE